MLRIGRSRVPLMATQQLCVAWVTNKGDAVYRCVPSASLVSEHAALDPTQMQAEPCIARLALVLRLFRSFISVTQPQNAKCSKKRLLIHELLEDALQSDRSGFFGALPLEYVASPASRSYATTSSSAS